MASVIIDIAPPKNVSKFSFLHLGFRPFFIGATSFAIIAMLLWMGIYNFAWDIQTYPPITWHAHEMIFGYSMAVIAGFLLTAIKNWTGKQTLDGYPLLLLFLLWTVTRILPFIGVPLIAIAISDNLFLLLLTIAIFWPFFKTQSWGNMIFVGVMLLFLASNIVFYLGMFDVFSNGIQYGLYAALYLILALILIMGRRVIPFFIEKGVDYPVQLKNWNWVDKSNFGIFALFAIADLLSPNSYISVGLAGLSAIINSIRLAGWYTKGIWKKSLLWILYVAYIFIIFGLLLKVLVFVSGISANLAVHAFAIGGIGMITVGMMARVSLGHTGRNVFAPPKQLWWIFILLGCGAVIRVIFPLLDSSLYGLWIIISQGLWIVAFSWFLYMYFSMLIYPRTDGHYG
ncbi:NnrS family protein [Candidatus Halobeggiatoa sp. HSG11]|nr:NnrS family protein [Candidatus Halobeggiatoa sp. HSG11]